mmetsp:Transcript_155911/g.283571  ORF Transcript_155911/g.283571 Transcript_155911/m.283571 type:complete len:615 (-) Transcript_155911:21-1865(-)
MNSLRGPLPTFGEKTYQDSRGGTTGAASDAVAIGGNVAHSPEPRGKGGEGMRLVTAEELSREREYWSDKFMSMAMDQIQVMTRKALSERDSESVQGDSGGSREGNAAMTARLNSLDLRIRAEEDQLNSVFNQINEVKAALNMLTVNLAEERRERQDTTQLAEMAVRTTRCITDELKGVNLGNQTALTSIDEAGPLKASPRSGGPEPQQVWEQLAGQIQRVAEEMRTEVRKDVMGSLRAELTSETARKVAALNSRVDSKVMALEMHVVSELKRFAGAFEERLGTVEGVLRTDARVPPWKESSATVERAGGDALAMSVDHFAMRPSTLQGIDVKRTTVFQQDDWSSVDAASTSTIKEENVAPENLPVTDYQSIPQSLKNELQGLADAVGQIISARPNEKPTRAESLGAPRQGPYAKGGTRTQSPASRNIATRARPASMQPAVATPTSSTLDDSLGRASSVEMHGARSQALTNDAVRVQKQVQVERGTSEPPQSNALLRRNVSPVSSQRKLSKDIPTSSPPKVDRAGSVGGLSGSSRAVQSIGGVSGGSIKVGVGGSAVLPQGGMPHTPGSIKVPLPASSASRQATPLSSTRIVPATSPRTSNNMRAVRTPDQQYQI